MKLFKSLALWVTMIALLFLTGCASIDPFAGTVVPVMEKNIGISEFKIDQPPVMTTGVPVWKYEMATEFAIPFPKNLEVEYRFYRVSWMAIGIDREGNFYPGVIVLDLNEGGRKNLEESFWAYGKVFASGDINLFILSTRAKFAYNAKGEEIPFDRKRIGDPQYGSQLFSRGTPIGDLSNPRIFDRIVTSWKVRRTPFGFVKSHLDDDKFNRVAVINTGYSRNETRIRDRHFRLSPNPIGMTIAWVMDAKGEISDYAGWTDTSGWDMDSPMRNEEREALVSILNVLRENSQIVEFQ